MWTTSPCTRSTGARLPPPLYKLALPPHTSHSAPRATSSTPSKPKPREARPNPSYLSSMAREASASSSASASELPPQPGGGGGGDTPRGRRRRARGDPLLIVCRCFSVVTAATAVLCVAVNVLSAVQSFRRNGGDIFGGIFRCYAVVISLFVGVVETEWGFILKFCTILEYWPARGMLQIFVAVMTKAYPNVERSDLILLQDIASYLLLACGLIYVISGVLCLGVLKRSRQQKATSREQAAKDLEELEKRREELEALLIAERSETV